MPAPLDALGGPAPGVTFLPPPNLSGGQATPPQPPPPAALQTAAPAPAAIPGVRFLPPPSLTAATPEQAAGQAAPDQNSPEAIQAVLGAPDSNDLLDTPRARILYDYTKKHSLAGVPIPSLASVWGGFKGVASGVVGAAGELMHPSQWGRVPVSGFQGALNDSAQTAELLRMLGRGAYERVRDSLEGASEDQKIEDFKNRFNDSLISVRALARGNTPDHTLVQTPGWAGKPLPNLTETAGNFGPTSLATFALGGEALAPLKGVLGTALKAIPGVARAAELGGTLLGKGLTKGLETTEAGGRLLSQAGRAPLKAVSDRLSSILPEGVSKIAELGGLDALITHHAGPIATPLKILAATDLVGRAVEQTSSFLRHLSETSGDNVRSRLLQVAADQSAPQWMKVAAGKLDQLGVGKAAQFVADMGQSAAHGAVMGAGMAALGAETPEQSGQMIGAGAGMGALGRGARKAFGLDAAARQIMAQVGARQRFTSWVLSPADQGGLGMSPDQAARIGDFTATVAGVGRDLLGDKVGFRFMEPGEDTQKLAAQAGQPGASAWFGDDPQSGKPTIFVQTGDDTGRLLHELPHAVARAVGADGEARLLIDSIFSKEQMGVMEREYAQRLVDGELQGQPKPDPEQYAGLINKKIEQLGSGPNGDKWIYDEVYAEAGFGGLLKKNIGRAVMGDTSWQRLGNMARGHFWSDMGEFVDPQTGAPEVPRYALFSNPDVYNNPKLRRLFYEHLQQIRKYGAAAEAGGKETKEGAPPGTRVNLDLYGNHPAVPMRPNPQTGLLENDAAVKNPKTGAVTLRKPSEIRRIERTRQESTRRVYENQPARPVTDTDPEVAPRVGADGKVEVVGTQISDQLAKMPWISEDMRQNARLAEQVIGEQGDLEKGGGVLDFWYQAIGHGWKWFQDVRKRLGNIAAAKVKLAPFLLKVSGEGNVLVVGLSVTRAQRKMARWSTEGKLNSQWGGDAGLFQKDLMTYLRNHAQGVDGGTGLNPEKKNILDHFVMGDNREFHDLNPLRDKWRGQDRQGLIMSARLDRMASAERAPETGWFTRYDRLKYNQSPNALFSPRPAKVKVNEPDRNTEEAKDQATRARGIIRQGPETRGWLQRQKINAFEPGVQAAQRATLPASVHQQILALDDKVNPPEHMPGVEPIKAVKPNYETDDATGLPTFYSDNGWGSYDEARSYVRYKAAAATARNLVLTILEEQAKAFGEPFDREAMFRTLGRSTSEPKFRSASDAASNLLLTTPEDFEAKKADLPPSVIEAAEAARAALPLMNESAPLWKYLARDAAADVSRFQMLANDSEGPVILDRSANYVYKITFPSFYQNEITPTPHAGPRNLNTKRADDFFDILNKYDRQNALRGALPIEIQGFTRSPGGKPFLILKMPKLERDATKAEALQWLKDNGGVGRQRTQLDPNGLIQYKKVGQNQPLAQDYYGNHYQLLDFREAEKRDMWGRRGATGKYPNLMVDADGHVLLTDTAPYPIDQAVADRVPELQKYTPPSEEAARNVAYSPDVGSSGEPQQGMSLPDDSPEGKRRRLLKEFQLLRQDKRNANAVIPSLVPGTARVKKIGYDLADSPLVKREGETRGISALADRVVKEVRSYRNKPDIMEAETWYPKIISGLRRVFGSAADTLSQLLAATSARTGVEDNFKISVEALKLYSEGKYDTLLKRYTDFVDANNGSDKGWDWEKGIPLKANGAKFNANSQQVLRVLAGLWAEKAGLKTKQFYKNLAGLDQGATIDVWAARTLRRLSYQREQTRWRILPQSEKGVAPKDFVFAQKVMSEAARTLNLDPSTVQSLLWFGEKDLWSRNGWTRGSGAVKSDFGSLLAKVEGNTLPGELPLDLTQHAAARFQAGVTTYREGLGRGKYTKEMAGLRLFMRKLPGVLAARVNRTEGLWFNKGAFEREPSFDVEATFRDPAAFDRLADYVRDLGKRAEQRSVYVSRMVDRSHPNARPQFEAYFRRAVSDKQAQAMTDAFVRAGIYGYTLIGDAQGRPTGFRSQFIPEFEGIDWASTDTAKREALTQEWLAKIEKARSSLDEKARRLIHFNHVYYYDTRVFTGK